MFTVRSGSVRKLFGSLGSIRSSFRFVTLTGFNFIIVRCNPGGGRRHECAERIESGKLWPTTTISVFMSGPFFSC